MEMIVFDWSSFILIWFIPSTHYNSALTRAQASSARSLFEGTQFLLQARVVRVHLQRALDGLDGSLVAVARLRSHCGRGGRASLRACQRAQAVLRRHRCWSCSLRGPARCAARGTRRGRGRRG